MINLGFRSGKNMPNVYLEPTIIDRILEGVGILIATVTWVLAIIESFELPTQQGKIFILPSVMTFWIAMFLWTSRAPIRFYGSPVKLNERNYVMQYLIATRFTRVVSLIGCLAFFCNYFLELRNLLGVEPGIFPVLMYVFAGLLLLSFIGYYIIAFLNR